MPLFIYMGSAFKSIYMSVGPRCQWKLQVLFYNILCICNFDRLFKLFLQMHPTITVSMGSGIQPWEKQSVSPCICKNLPDGAHDQNEHFYNSVLKHTCPPSPRREDPSSLLVCAGTHHKPWLFHSCKTCTSHSSSSWHSDTVTACLNCNAKRAPTQFKIDSNCVFVSTYSCHCP